MLTSARCLPVVRRCTYIVRQAPVAGMDPKVISRLEKPQRIDRAAAEEDGKGAVTFY